MNAIFHLLGAIQFGFGVYYDYMYVQIPDGHPVTSKTFGGKLKFLTFLDAIILMMYFTISFLNDIFGTNEMNPSKKPLLRRIKDTMFCSFVFPIAFFVGLTFWSLYLVDRELIFPTGLDKFFPNWLNHLMHTSIMVYALIELITNFRMYPRRKTGISLLTSFMLAYLVWVHFVFYMSNVWVYPVLALLTWPLKVVFYLGCLSLILLLYILGEKLNSFVWKKHVEKIKKISKKKAF